MYEIKIPKTRADFKAYYALRYRVLSEPWGHAKGTEKDDYEPISEHFMVVNENDECVGVAKLFEKTDGIGQLSHLAVAPEHQQKGVGRLLLGAIEARAREHEFQTMGIMARVTAAPYFEKYGFHIAGLPTPSLGTTHLVWMEKSLS